MKRFFTSKLISENLTIRVQENRIACVAVQVCDSARVSLSASPASFTPYQHALFSAYSVALLVEISVGDILTYFFSLCPEKICSPFWGKLKKKQQQQQQQKTNKHEFVVC